MTENQAISLGSVEHGAIAITATELRQVRIDYTPYSNVVWGLGAEQGSVGDPVTFEVVVVMQRGVGAVVITTRHGTAPSASKYVDWMPFQPDQLHWSADNELNIAHLPGRIVVDPVAACCLHAWQSQSIEEYRQRTRSLAETVNPEFALLVFSFAKNSSIGSILSWSVPFPVVEDEVLRLVGDSAAWCLVCEAVKFSGLEQRFCRNLAMLPSPAAQAAAVRLASEINSRNLRMSLLIGTVGVAAAVAGFVLFNPISKSSFMGWLLVGGGFLLVFFAGWCYWGGRVSLGTDRQPQ